MGMFRSSSLPLAARQASILLAMDVMHEDAGSHRRHREPHRPLERSLGILVAALPVLAHRGAGEFVILGVSLVSLLLVDDVQDGDLRQVRELLLQAALLVRELLLGQCRTRAVDVPLPGVYTAADMA